MQEKNDLFASVDSHVALLLRNEVVERISLLQELKDTVIYSTDLLND